MGTPAASARPGGTLGQAQEAALAWAPVGPLIRSGWTTGRVFSLLFSSTVIIKVSVLVNLLYFS